MTHRGAMKRTRIGSWFVAAALAVGVVVVPGFSATAADIEPGGSVYIGAKQGYSGTGTFPIWSD